MNEIALAITVLGLSALGYLVLMFLFGYTSSIRPVCPSGQRALSVDGSKNLLPKSSTDLVTPNADFPICAPRLSCPAYAVHRDGSALTSNCEEADCPCTQFQHCPVYASTVFRQFGRDDRISMFQVIDPAVREKAHPQNPYEPPYILLPGLRDSCYLTPGTLNMMWPPLKLGDPCLRGTLAQLSTSPSLYVCGPSQYVKDRIASNGTIVHEFDVETYMTAYML